MNKKEFWKRRLAGIKGKAVIGLTGPIASGKSLALELFRGEGAFCVSTDALAAEVLTSPACYNRISRKFGPEKILTNGLLDRKRLAAEVFRAPAKRKWLEELLHPEILKRTYSLIKRSKAKIAVVEAPLLFEAGFQDCFLLIVCFAVPGRLLEERVLERGWSRAEYRARARAQFSPERKAELASLTLENAGGRPELAAKVKFLCGFLKELNKGKAR